MQRKVAEAVVGQETTASVIARLAATFSLPEHTFILKSLCSILRKRPCVVLLDSGEVYQVREPITNATVSAILGTCYFFATDWGGQRLYAKAAFPSEILPQLFQYNRAKFQDRIVLITWTYKDLVTFLAKRFRHAIAPTPTDDEYEALSNFHTALHFSTDTSLSRSRPRLGFPSIRSRICFATRKRPPGK